MSQTGIQPNIGPRVVSATKPKGVIHHFFFSFSCCFATFVLVRLINCCVNWKFLLIFQQQVRMYHGDIANTNSDSLASQSSALCGEPFAYNPHSGMYIKFGKTYITHVSETQLQCTKMVQNGSYFSIKLNY